MQLTVAYPVLCIHLFGIQYHGAQRPAPPTSCQAYGIKHFQSGGGADFWVKIVVLTSIKTCPKAFLKWSSHVPHPWFCCPWYQAAYAATILSGIISLCYALQSCLQVHYHSNSFIESDGIDWQPIYKLGNITVKWEVAQREWLSSSI